MSYKLNDNRINIYRASQYINNHKMFLHIIFNIYTLTDNACKIYPKYFSWYWQKVVPAIINGTRDAIMITFDEEVAGAVLVKKEDGEKKICTLYVDEKYRNKGFGTILLKEAFGFLETTKPLITLGSDRLEIFSSIISKYDWKQTQILPNGYYNDQTNELVFNGTII